MKHKDLIKLLDEHSVNICKNPYYGKSNYCGHPMAKYKLQMFTVPTQHVYADTAGELLVMLAEAVDPYRKFREAQERGETIQLKTERGWVDEGQDFNPEWSKPEYLRIKPKTKTLYLWAVNSNGSWSTHNWFCESEEDVQRAYNKKCVNEFKRLDYTAIEVEA